MSLEQKLILKQSQKLVMTPALRQAIKLLPMARFELVQEIRSELVENPLLEEISNLEESSSPPEGEETSPSSEGEEANISEIKDDFSKASGEENLNSPEIDWETYIQSSIDEMGFIGNYSEAPSYENRITKTASLSDHLEWQLDLSYKEPIEREIGKIIIGNLDSRGYLKTTIQEIADSGDYPIEDISNALKLIQSFDPSGIGARDLKECLLLQIQQRGLGESLAAVIIESFLEDVEKQNFENIAKKLGVSMGKVSESIKLIKGLTPNPAYRFSSDETHYVVPDIIVVKTLNDYKVILNDEGIPRLTINPFYKKILTDKRSNTTREYVENKFKSALWLIKSIEQRRNTVLKVARSIVKFQKSFLDKGIEHVKPLVLRDVADDIGMHESTVSRVTSNKYMHTPQGLFEFKYFFHSSIDSRFGSSTSSVMIKNAIKNIIGNEDSQKPITDFTLTAMLNERDINIARRTVTKYRKELKIQTAGKRKRKLI